MLISKNWETFKSQIVDENIQDEDEKLVDALNRLFKKAGVEAYVKFEGSTFAHDEPYSHSIRMRINLKGSSMVDIVIMLKEFCEKYEFFKDLHYILDIGPTPIYLEDRKKWYAVWCQISGFLTYYFCTTDEYNQITEAIAKDNGGMRR